MLNFNKPFYKILTELCQELNIESTDYSYGYFKRLKKDGKIRNIMMQKLDLNSVVAINIANDKYATYEFLKSNNIPIIKHNVFFNPKTRNGYWSESDLENAKKIFEKYNNKVVIKANDSFQGKEVYLVDNKKDIKKVMENIFNSNNDSLSICPFEDIKNEYRVIVLDNECLLCYKKALPRVIGDGKKRIKDYIQELDIKKPDSNFDLEYIPKKGEEVLLSWKFNLSSGAIPKKVDNLNTKNILEKIALDTAKVVNIRFASVDIIENKSGEFKVMEVNATVCLNKFAEKYPNGYEIAKDIYRKALIKMFE